MKNKYINVKEEILPALGNDIAPRLEPMKKNSTSSSITTSSIVWAMS